MEYRIPWQARQKVSMQNLDVKLMNRLTDKLTNGQQNKIAKKKYSLTYLITDADHARLVCVREGVDFGTLRK